MTPSDDRKLRSSLRPVAGGALERLVAQSQREFEIELYASILARDPLLKPVLKAQADHLSAVGEFDKAYELDQRIVRLYPDLPVPWYNLACSCSLLGLIDQSLEAIEKALRLGYRPLNYLLRDPDLKTLRVDPRFATLIRRYIKATPGR